MLTGKAKPRRCEKKVSEPKAKIKIHEGSVRSLSKNIIGRCWPGRLSQGDLKKELANRKAKIKIHEGSVGSLPKNIIGRCWPGRLCEKRAGEPKGEN
jgi:hypothetical protein